MILGDCHILYVDDDAAMRRLVQRDLERHGFSITLAEDGPSGEVLASKNQYDVICLDQHMPGQDGLETLKKLQKLSDPPPVVFVTGSEDGRLAVAALRAGAVDYVIKEAGGEFLHLLRATVSTTAEREQLRRVNAQTLRDLHAARDRAENLAEQRAVLLREVNHRVANSLQLITSLTLIQERRTTDSAIRAALTEVRGRISAVAQVHRRLYTSHDVRQVHLNEYLAGLVAEIGRSIDTETDALVVEFSGVGLMVPTDIAVSVGMITAELVANALKYAYPTNHVGTVRVSLSKDAHWGLLTVADDGVGVGGTPSGTGLGQAIIRAMTEALGGEVSYPPVPNGTVATIRFPATTSTIDGKVVQ